VLARHIEAAGIPTVVVTMMPDIAEWLLAPRIVGVEFPFGHSFGPPGDDATHTRVLATALTVLAGAGQPPETGGAGGVRIDIDMAWPFPRGEAYKSWQPAEPSPIVAMMLERRPPT